jgi:hypothetical protein
MRFITKKLISIFFLCLLFSCQDFGSLHFMADLPKELDKVSGIELIKGADLI